MSVRDDERAQAIQVGAILLFGVLIILLATYQAFVVPNQNREIEGNHIESVAADFQDLRSEILSVTDRAQDPSVTLKLGVQYPARVVALNPPPPTGTVRTVAAPNTDVNVTVTSAVGLDGEAGDFWTGTNRSFNSGAVSYRPNYNEFRNAPTMVVDNTLLYHAFPERNLTRAGQQLVDGKRLSLVAINGSLDRTESGPVTVDVQAVSASSRRLSITNETGDNVTVEFASRLDAGRWTDELRDDDQFVDQGGHVVDVTDALIAGTDFREVRVELEGDVTYSLGMKKIGLGTRVADELPAYLTDVGGDSRTIQEGSSTTLPVEVRDRFNNPMSGVSVNGSVEAGSQNGTLAAATVTTDEDGRAIFEYEADQIDGASPTFQVNVTYEGEPGTGFDPAVAENASMNVTVQNTDGSGAGGGGGGNAYATSWLDPSGQTGVTCPNGADGTCTVDASQTGTATLTMQTSPTAVNAEVDYSLNDTAIGSLDPLTGETDSSGENSTDFSPTQEGAVKLFTSSGGSGDTLVLKVINVVLDLVFNNDATAEDGPDGDSVAGGVEFTMTNQYSQSLEITEVEIGDPPGPANVLDDEVTPNDEPQRTELYVEADSNDGWVDVSGGTSLPVTFDMDSSGFNNNGNPTATSGSTLRFFLYEFEQNNGDRVDMSGESFDVTVFYELSNGTTDTTTMTVSPS